MKARLVRVDLSDDARDFRAIAVEPGVAMLDTAGNNAQLLWVWLDRFVIRPGERWPWPALSQAGFVPGALEEAPINRAFEFTGPRRLCFNGASEGTLTMGSYGDADSVHWGLQAGTLEFWCKPLWDADDSENRVLFYAKAYGHRLQSRLFTRDDGQLEWTIADSDGMFHSVCGPAALRTGAWPAITSCRTPSAAPN